MTHSSWIVVKRASVNSLCPYSSDSRVLTELWLKKKKSSRVDAETHNRWGLLRPLRADQSEQAGLFGEGGLKET